jgi:hypothetical protein
MRAWEEGSSRPSQPLLAFEDETLTVVSIGIAVDDQFSPAVSSSVAFRSFTSIPEPPTMMLSAIFFAGVFAWQWRRWS